MCLFQFVTCVNFVFFSKVWGKICKVKVTIKYQASYYVCETCLVCASGKKGMSGREKRPFHCGWDGGVQINVCWGRRATSPKNLPPPLLHTQPQELEGGGSKMECPLFITRPGTHASNSYPTTNGWHAKWKLSRNTYALRTHFSHVWHRLACSVGAW